MDFLKAIKKMKTGKYEFMTNTGGSIDSTTISDGLFLTDISGTMEDEMFLEFRIITDDGEKGDEPYWTPSLDDYLDNDWECFTSKSYLRKYKKN